MDETRRYEPDNALTVVDVCDRLSRRLAWYGLPTLRPGIVIEKDDDTIVALLTGHRDMRPVRLLFDRHTGRMSPVLATDGFVRQTGTTDQAA